MPVNGKKKTLGILGPGTSPCQYNHLQAITNRAHGNSKDFVDLNTLPSKNLGFSLAVIIAHGESSNRNSSDESHTSELLVITDNTAESLLLIQQKTGIKNFILSSCFSSAVLNDLAKMAKENKFLDGTSFIINGSSNNSVFSVETSDRETEAVELFKKGQSLEEVFPTLATTSAETTNYATINNGKLYAIKAVSRQVSKYSTVDEYWQSGIKSKHENKDLIQSSGRASHLTCLSNHNDKNEKELMDRVCTSIQEIGSKVSDKAKQQYLDRAFMMSVYRDKEESVNDFLSIGANVNAKSGNGSNAIRIATDHGNLEVVQRLTNCPSLNFKTKYMGQTSQQFAKTKSELYTEEEAQKYEDILQTIKDAKNKQAVLPKQHGHKKSRGFTTAVISERLGDFKTGVSQYFSI